MRWRTILFLIKVIEMKSMYTKVQNNAVQLIKIQDTKQANDHQSWTSLSKIKKTTFRIYGVNHRQLKAILLIGFVIQIK